MDFHFYTARAQVKKQTNLKRSLLVFLPLFILAGILPITLNLVKNPVTDRFNSSAAQNDLTIWFTPSTVIVSKGTPVTLELHANFDSGDLLPGVHFPISKTGAVTLSQSQISFIKPFNGEVKIGEITVTPTATGEVILTVNKEDIVSDTFTGKFNAIISPAKIIVR